MTFLSYSPSFWVFRKFELELDALRHEIDIESELTMGKISGVLKVTSYTSLSSLRRLVYPEMTSFGTPLSSSSVKVTKPLGNVPISDHCEGLLIDARFPR